MKTLKKTPIFTLALVFIFVIQICCSAKNINTNLSTNKTMPINVGVLLYDFNDVFLSEVRKNLTQLGEVNKDKIQFTFFDGKSDANLQNQIADSLIQKNINLLILNLLEKEEGLIDQIIYKAKQKSIPVILFNSTPLNLNTVKNYKKSLIVKSDAEQSGALQGKILVDAWNADKKSLDRNRDNIMQYVMLQGNPSSIQTTIRTTSSIKAIHDAGIQTEEIASVICNWSKQEAKTVMESLFLRYGPKIEIVIANNDAMAIGAIEALQKYGYNTGNKLKNIAVVGIDALPEAQDLIRKGFMFGSITQDTQAMSEILYTVGMNLVLGKNPTDGTNYEFDDTRVTLIIPHKEFTINAKP